MRNIGLAIYSLVIIFAAREFTLGELGLGQWDWWMWVLAGVCIGIASDLIFMSEERAARWRKAFNYYQRGEE